MKLAAVVPAHNEEENIAKCIESLVTQTCPPEKIVVVNDASSDKTEEILIGLCQKYLQLTYLNKEADGSMRAGAVNAGLRLLNEDGYDLVLIADADAVLAADLVEEAVKGLKQDEAIGGMCSAVEVRGRGILYRLQKLEYGSFNADRTGTWRNVMIIHGLCGVYRLKAMQDVKGYSGSCLLEDYDLTLKLKKAGWKTVFNPKMKAEAESVPSLRQLIRQRIRWFRGGIDIILDHGINCYTAYDVLNHLIFILLFIVVGTIVGLGVVYSSRWSPRLYLHPIPIILFLMGWFDGVWRLRWVQNRDRLDVVIRLIFLPELIYYTFLSLIKIYCYLLALKRAERRW